MNLKELGQDFLNELLTLADKLLDRIPKEKQRFFLFTLGGLILLAICLTVVALSTGQRQTVSIQAIGPRIPAEELFYPGEPDFLPPLLFEREPNQLWTLSELEQFWQDPKVGNEELWQDAIITVVDRLLDGVP